MATGPEGAGLVINEPLSPLAQDLRRALGARYTIVREVGSGGAALVYLAQDHKHD